MGPSGSPVASSIDPPTRPACPARRIVSAAASGESPYPFSRSAATGRSVASTICRAFSSASFRPTDPSGLPSENASPALVVVSASKPRLSRIFPVPASQGFGMTKAPGRSWRAWKRTAFSAWVTLMRWILPGRGCQAGVPPRFEPSAPCDETDDRGDDGAPWGGRQSSSMDVVYLHPGGGAMADIPSSVSRIELLQGTLDLLVLQTLRWGPRHGYGIAQMIRSGSRDALRVDTGSLYPALHRLEKQGAISAEWETSENKQRVRVYRLTAAGRKQLAAERSKWEQLAEAIAGVMAKPAGSES